MRSLRQSLPWSPSRLAKRVLPFGDSITFGVGSTDAGGYRSQLYALALAAGKPLRLVGSLTAGPGTVNGVAFPADNEGHSGYTIANTPVPTNGITELCPYPALANQPDVVLLHIGVNDINYTAGLSTLLARLDTLMGIIQKALPNATVVVAQNTPINGAIPPEWTTYVNGIPGLVATRQAAGQRFLVCSMQSLTLADLSDSVHPNDSGYSKMAAIWYAAIKDLL